MTLVDFFDYYSEPILAVLVVCALVVLGVCNKQKVVKSVLLQLVIDAEALWGSGTGNIKHDVVVGWVKQKFPTLFLFISDKTLDKWITDMVQYIKDNLGEENIQSAALGVESEPPDTI